ncbi:MAG: GDSL-type esterase/lipase family protein, partial [Actinobacteria bacterium]|nr:GDSL-type esterase/lipase family protein [Actinomycetota bacterium]
MGSRSALATLLTAGAAILGAAVLAPGARGQSPAAQCGTTHWIGAWGADPGGTLGAGFADQTLRMILTPHVGGAQLRIHLSNRFGPQPVAFNHVTIALRQAGAGIVPGSSHPVTFAGQLGVIVPAGADAVSDPVSMTVAPFEDLAVSLYLRGPTGPASGHYIARERSYLTGRSAGDHAGDDGPGAFVGSTTTTDYLDGVDVLGPAGVGAAVLFGDSLTDGYENAGPGSTEEQGGIDLGHRYPDYLARRLLAAPGGQRLSVVNAGISGNRLLGDGQGSAGGPSGLSRLDPDVLGVPGATDAVVLEGINDIALLASANQVESGLHQAVDHLHAGGLHVLLGTIPPAGTGLLSLGTLLPAIYIDSSANAVRVAVNAWIRSGSTGADGIVDFDRALRSATLPNELNPQFDSGDHVHPSYLGYSRMADTIDLASLRG